MDTLGESHTKYIIKNKTWYGKITTSSLIKTIKMPVLFNETLNSAQNSEVVLSAALLTLHN